MFGDFNFPKTTLTWCDTDEGIVPVMTDCRDEEWRSCELLLEMSMTCLLSQQVSTPTRGDSFLDLLFVSDPDLVHDVTVSSSRISDHDFVLLKTNIQTEKTKPPQNDVVQEDAGLNKFNFKHTDWDLLREKLRECNLAHVVKNATDVVEGFSKFTDTLVSACLSAQVPLRKQSKNIKRIPVHRRKLFRKRCKVAMQLKTYSRVDRLRIEKLQSKLRTLDDLIIQSLNEQRIKEEEQAVEDISREELLYIC